MEITDELIFHAQTWFLTGLIAKPEQLNRNIGLEAAPGLKAFNLRVNTATSSYPFTYFLSKKWISEGKKIRRKQLLVERYQG